MIRIDLHELCWWPHAATSQSKWWWIRVTNPNGHAILRGKMMINLNSAVFKNLGAYCRKWYCPPYRGLSHYCTLSYYPSIHEGRHFSLWMLLNSSLVGECILLYKWLYYYINDYIILYAYYYLWLNYYIWLYYYLWLYIYIIWLYIYILYDYIYILYDYIYIWLYMIIYDYIWWYMIIYDYIWLYMIIYDYIWIHMIIYYYIWLYMIIYDY